MHGSRAGLAVAEAADEVLGVSTDSRVGPGRLVALDYTERPAKGRSGSPRGGHRLASDGGVRHWQRRAGTIKAAVLEEEQSFSARWARGL